MIKIKKFAAVIFIIQAIVCGQTLSLKECINYALSNNINIKVSNYEKCISQSKTNEFIGSALPQISASASMDDNLKVSTQMMPGEMVGKPGTQVPVQMGSQYNTSAGIQVDQQIYDAHFWANLKSSRINAIQSSLNTQKSKEQTVYQVCRTYFQTQIIKKQTQLLDAICNAAKESLIASQLKFDNGLTNKIDVDKIKISYSNSTSMAEQAHLNYKHSLNSLRYQMGMPIDTQITIDTTTPFSIQNDVREPIKEGQLCFENRTDYQLLKTSLSLQQANRAADIASNLPSLSFNAKYNFQSMANELADINDWYSCSSIGLRLSVPIFDGLQTRNKLAQTGYNIDIAKENITAAKRSIKVEVSNSEMQYKNALDNIQNEKSTLELANEVYYQTQLSFTHGAASSLDLIQAESSWRDAQNNYFSKLLTLYFARLDLEQAKGTLLEFIETTIK